MLESMVLIYNNDLKKELIVTKKQEVTINEVSVYNILGQRWISVERYQVLMRLKLLMQRGAYIKKCNKGTVSKKSIETIIGSFL
jgi:hypothetical protein